MPKRKNNPIFATIKEKLFKNNSNLNINQEIDTSSDISDGLSENNLNLENILDNSFISGGLPDNSLNISNKIDFL